MHFSGKIKSRLTIYPSRFFVLIWKVMERKGYWRGSQIPLEGGQAAGSSSPIILPNMTRSQSKVKQSDNSSQTYFCNPIWSMDSITEKIPPLKKKWADKHTKYGNLINKKAKRYSCASNHLWKVAWGKKRRVNIYKDCSSTYRYTHLFQIFNLCKKVIAVKGKQSWFLP